MRWIVIAAVGVVIAVLGVIVAPICKDSRGLYIGSAMLIGGCK